LNKVEMKQKFADVCTGSGSRS